MSTTSTPSVPQQRSLADVVDIVSGFGFPKELQGKPKGDLPFFKVGDISIAWNSGQKNLTRAQHYLDQAEASSIRAKAFPKGTVVFAKIGEAIRLNRRAILGQPSIVDNNVMGLIPKEGVVDPTYLFYWSLMLRLGDISQATTVPSVRKSDVEQLSFPWLPLDQQKRIVAEIEKQFSRLDEAVSNLKRVKANLKRYKAAVLKAAASGRLVETEAELVEAASRRLDQRQDAATTYETGEQLLQRILETRRSQWQGKGKYKEPAAPDTTDLPELPEGWVWATVDQLLMSLRNGLSKKPEDSEPGIPILRISSVRPLELDTKDSRFYRLQTNECVDDYKLEVGDVLFVRYNGTKELVGVCALVNVVTGALLYPDKLIRGRVVNEQQVSPSYLAIAANVGRSRQHIDELIKTTAGQQGIAGGEIKQMPLPLPPFAEQLHIVVEIDRRLSLIREIETQVDANFQRAERLRQSILAKAFSGLLLQQYGVKECAESAISG